MNIAVPITPSALTIQEFEALCKSHDWTFEWSDDHSKWMAGNRVQRQIEGQLRTGAKGFKAIYLRYCVLPWEDDQVVDAYKKVRTETDLRVGVEARKAWESRTTLDPLYATLPRHKQGWWWLCELSRFLEQETGETGTRLGTWNYKHLDSL